MNSNSIEYIKFYIIEFQEKFRVETNYQKWALALPKISFGYKGIDYV
jgi:hypothetical protein